MSETLRVALVGLGDAGAHHARALKALHGEGRMRWVACCGRDPARTLRYCEAQGVDLQPWASLDAMLDAGGIDAVVLATPDGLHGSQALRLAEGGVHALVEKPLALDAESAFRAVEAFREKGLRLGVGYQLRHHAGHRLAREALETRVGRLRRVDLRWTWPDPAVDGWRARGEGSRWWSLAALGTHALDLALWFARRGPEDASSVEAIIDREGPVDRRAEVCLGFGDGLTLHVAVSVEYRSVPRLSIVGDLGELEALGTLGARGEGTLVHRLPRGATELLPFQPVDPYQAQLQAFLAAVEGGQEPSASGSVGARQVRLLERLTAR